MRELSGVIWNDAEQQDVSHGSVSSVSGRVGDYVLFEMRYCASRGILLTPLTLIASDGNQLPEHETGSNGSNDAASGEWDAPQEEAEEECCESDSEEEDMSGSAKSGGEISDESNAH